MSHRGTVFPANPFHPEEACEALKKAFKGFGTDEKVVTSIITGHDNDQRQVIRKQYKAMYDKDLIKVLKSELSGDYQDFIIGLVQLPEEHHAECIKKAIKGAGTDEDTLTEIFVSINNCHSNLPILKDAYYKLYGKPLIDAVQGDVKKDFGKLILGLISGNREDNLQVDVNLAQQDAQDLINAGIGQKGTDESIFISILNARSFPQLKHTFKIYESMSSTDLVTDIKKEFKGDLENALLAIVGAVRDMPGYFAERLHASMKKLGTDEKSLTRIIVSRSEYDLSDIKRAYQRLYNKDLAEVIKKDTSGDYGKALQAVIA